jgi:hypothetical protein
MHITRFLRHCIPGPIAGCALTVALVTGVLSQSQEPKPPLPGDQSTPVAVSTPLPETTGIDGNSWQGPRWGVGVTWDPAFWVVEDEFLTPEYDGIRLGTPRSTVYVEAYEGFGGDALACLADAEEEIRARQNLSEVSPLEGQTLPPAADTGAAQLFGLVVNRQDGTPFRIVEMASCRQLVPGEAVLELTWQTSAESFNDELPLVSALFDSLDLGVVAPGANSTPPLDEPRASPIATPLA